MNSVLKNIILSFVVFTAMVGGTAYAIERGDWGFVCYESRSGLLWSKEVNFCEFIVVDVLGNSNYRVEFTTICLGHSEYRKGYTALLKGHEMRDGNDSFCLEMKNG